MSPGLIFHGWLQADHHGAALALLRKRHRVAAVDHLAIKCLLNA